MQISANNLLIAAQQAARPPIQPAAAARPAAFEPLAFAEKTAASVHASPAKPYTQASPPGSQLDIRI